MKKIIRKTRSLCPVCGLNLPAVLAAEENGTVYLERTCPKHGGFSVPVWEGRVDFDAWTRGAAPLGPGQGEACTGRCGLCGEHESGSCCVLLEVTGRCDLRCRFCFADGGKGEDIPAEELKAAIRDIARRGKPMLQLSGGEPTLRDDLPELVAYAREAGCSYVQVNTNGLRLAREPDYAKRLADAGTDIIFLQFDGTRDEIFRTLRGQPLLEAKREAVRICAEAGMGVTLVPTVVPGVNEDNLGDLVRFAASQAPNVRGVHFQPVSYFGRFPHEAGDRCTLDRLISDLCDQLGVRQTDFLPSRCDHPLCGFHARYLIGPGGELQALTDIANVPRTRGTAQENRDFVARQWKKAEPGPKPAADFGEEMDFDTFLTAVRQRSLTLSAMAFQDAMNLNLERLHRCSLHVYDRGSLKPFCARYLTLAGEREAVE